MSVSTAESFVATTLNDCTHNSAKMISRVHSWEKIRYGSFLNDTLFTASKNVNSLNERC